MIRSRRASLLWAVGAIALGALLTDCGDSGSGPGNDGGTNATLGNIQSGIFRRSCAFTSCHSSTARKGELDLSNATACYAQLVGVLAANDAARAAGLRRVAPGQPDSSFLIIKLTQPGAGEGVRMPSSNPPLSPGSIQLIRDWIAAGAPNN